jgi:integrase
MLNKLSRILYGSARSTRDLNRLYTRKRRDGSLEYDWLPMTDALMVLLIEWKKSSPGKWVFPDPKTGEPYTYRRRWLKGLCKRAGVKPFGLHGIRHLTASMLMQADVPLIDIKDILRHKNLTTTEKYIHRLKSVRASLRVLEGKSKSSEGGQLTSNSPNKKSALAVQS